MKLFNILLSFIFIACANSPQTSSEEEKTKLFCKLLKLRSDTCYIHCFNSKDEIFIRTDCPKEEMKYMNYVFDIDGTICTNTNGDYENAKPYEAIVTGKQ